MTVSQAVYNYFCSTYRKASNTGIDPQTRNSDSFRIKKPSDLSTRKAMTDEWTAIEHKLAKIPFQNVGTALLVQSLRTAGWQLLKNI